MDRENEMSPEAEELLREFGDILDKREGRINWDYPVPPEKRKQIQELKHLRYAEPSTMGRNMKWKLTELGAYRIGRLPKK